MKNKKSKKKTKKNNKKQNIKTDMPDHIDEYFVKNEGSKEAIQSRELFNADNKNIDLKTDLSNEEINYINTLLYNDRILISRGLKPVNTKYLFKYMRLKVSKDRLSRSEFVKINKENQPDELLQTASNLKNITNTKK